MENKNVLLVVASVSLFLVIVLAAGLWLFWPQEEPESAAVTVEPLFSPPGQFDSFEYTRGRQELPGLSEPITITIGEAVPSPTAVAVEPRGETTTVPQTTPRPTPAVVRRVPAPAVPRPPAPRTVKVSEYWIQAGSFKSQTRADDVNGRLAKLGIPGTIRTREIAGETYFRVRIGPYENRPEAEKFLGYLKGVEGLADSYISLVPRTKTVN